MSNKLSKDRAFERTISKYWEKLVNGILVPGERGCAPSMGEILCAYNDMKSRQPECKYVTQKKARANISSRAINLEASESFEHSNR